MTGILNKNNLRKSVIKIWVVYIGRLIFADMLHWGRVAPLSLLKMGKRGKVFFASTVNAQPYLGGCLHGGGTAVLDGAVVAGCVVGRLDPGEHGRCCGGAVGHHAVDRVGLQI